MNNNGLTFHAWADVYFVPEKFNNFIPKIQVLEDFNRETGQAISSQNFSSNLMKWAQFKGYEYNPPDLAGSAGRIIHTIDVTDREGVNVRVPAEMLYIRTTTQEDHRVALDKSWIDESQSITFLEEKDGLTLRDQFAMAALPALIEKYGKLPVASMWAYEVADQMMEARAQRVF